MSTGEPAMQADSKQIASGKGEAAWGDAAGETVRSYRRMIDSIARQLSDEELHLRPAEGFNSVAILLRHLGGNLRSRWTDFLTTDGEKPDRDRDAEFLDWEGDRESLLKYFDTGWEALVAAIDAAKTKDAARPITIRGETHTVADAVFRSLTHIAYHVGQMAMIARMVHQAPWDWLTIPPGKSAEFNSTNWGAPTSRGALADPGEPE